MFTVSTIKPPLLFFFPLPLQRCDNEILVPAIFLPRKTDGKHFAFLFFVPWGLQLDYDHLHAVMKSVRSEEEMARDRRLQEHQNVGFVV